MRILRPWTPPVALTSAKQAMAPRYSSMPRPREGPLKAADMPRTRSSARAAPGRSRSTVKARAREDGIGVPPSWAAEEVRSSGAALLGLSLGRGEKTITAACPPLERYPEGKPMPAPRRCRRTGWGAVGSDPAVDAAASGDPRQEADPERDATGEAEGRPRSG